MRRKGRGWKEKEEEAYNDDKVGEDEVDERSGYGENKEARSSKRDNRNHEKCKMRIKLELQARWKHGERVSEKVALARLEKT